MSDNKDVVVKGAEDVIAYLNYVLRERGQLYGTLIYLMQLFDKRQVVMPTIESLKEYHKSFYITFEPGEDDGMFYVNLKDREEDYDVESGV